MMSASARFPHALKTVFTMLSWRGKLDLCIYIMNMNVIVAQLSATKHRYFEA